MFSEAKKNRVSKQSKKRSRRSGKRNSANQTLGFEQLERRELLASFLSNTGQLTVLGTTGGDNITVQTFIPSNEVRVFINSDPFDSYTASDINIVKVFAYEGDDTVSVSVGLNVPTEIIGSAGDDVIYGSRGRDYIVGGLGSDRVYGYGGNDKIIGNDGRDFLFGGDGADELHGTTGDDEMYGGGGDDIMYGGSGNDLMLGQGGRDRVFGHAGDNRLLGGTGDDFLFGNSGKDHMLGGTGNDELFGYGGDDTINGNEGSDRVVGHGGDDSLAGGTGDDAILGGDGADRINAGPGDDSVWGGNGSDLINGISGANEIYGGRGADTIFGGINDDIIYGGDEGDTIRGFQGDDTIHGNHGDDILRGDEGDDEVFGGLGNDRIYGGEGDDVLRGNAGFDQLFGEEGTDNLLGGLGEDDTLQGGGGMDRMLADESDTVLDFTGQDAVVRFENGNQTWSEVEVNAINDGLDILVNRTGNNTLLNRSNLSLSNHIELVLSNDSTAGLGQNDPNGGDRIIRLSDNALNGNNFLNASAARVLIHEIGHSWQFVGFENGPDTWQDFIAVSGWTMEDMSDNDNFTLNGASDEEEWWYESDSQFATIRNIDQRGRDNPYEDWSSMWEEYFFVSTTGTGDLGAKLAIIDNFFTLISS